MDYKDFLKLPEIKEAFDKMYSAKKRYFREKALGNNRFDREHLEITSIKMSFIATDLYFSDLHRTKFPHRQKISQR